MKRMTSGLGALALLFVGSQAAASVCTSPANVNALASEIAQGLNFNRACF